MSSELATRRVRDRQYGLTHSEGDGADPSVHPDLEDLLVHPQVENPHGSVEVTDSDDVDRRAARDGRHRRRGSSRQGSERVDERPGADVVESEGSLSGSEEDLVEVGRRVEDVGRGEVGRERDRRGQL